MRAVAARAGVSLATVSRVISKSPLVRPETAAHVQRVIAEMQFVPNASATTLKYGRSDTFGIIIANVANPFYLEFIRDFEALLTSKQQGVLLANTEFPERIEGSVHRMLKNRVDGVIIIPAAEEFEPFNRLSLHNIPVVTFDRRSIKHLVSDISYKFEQGMLEAVSHLYELGHRRIGLIGGSKGLNTSRLRRKGFLSAMRKREIPVYEEWMIDADYRLEGGGEAMRILMKGPRQHRPTAVIVVNDLMALGALRVAHSLKISVPGDVSLIGMDNIMLADVVTPALTTIELPRNRIAQACMDAFTHMAQHSEENGRQFLIDTKLIVRESTAPIPQG